MPAILTIDCAAIVDNYRRLSAICTGKVAAVVKANSYGLGASKIAQILEKHGCAEFFVANIGEAIELRQSGVKGQIYVLHGVRLKDVDEFIAYNLVPVLNNPEQIIIWNRAALQYLKKLPAIIHIDTGIARLGLSLKQALSLYSSQDVLVNIDVLYIMSHLACADQAEHFHNYRQLRLFQGVKKLLPQVKLSLSNSSGIFLGEEYHFDLVRPGMALYGLNPTLGANPMLHVVQLHTEIIQINQINRKTRVGYGASYTSKPGDVLATIAIGYADGYMRTLSNMGYCYIAGYRVPIIGRISMDLTVIDVSGLPGELLYIGQKVELIGDNMQVDSLAAHGGTIGYEILTSLGQRGTSNNSLNYKI